MKAKNANIVQTRRRMARERRGAGSSLVSMETPYYKQYIKDVLGQTRRVVSRQYSTSTRQ